MLEKQIIINDLLINYLHLSARQKSDRAVVFLHGWRSRAAVWLPLLQLLDESSFDIYALDFPGFGKSQNPPGTWKLENYADTVRSFAGKIGLKKFILVGHSFGGRVGLRLAAQSRQYLDKLILVDSGGMRTRNDSLAWKKNLSKLIKPLFKPSFMQPLRRKVYEKMGAEDYLATPHMTGTFLNIINEDLSLEIKQILTPTLIIWGADDHITPIIDARLMHQRIQGSKLEIIPDAGHYCFLDQPKLFAGVLMNFIND